MRPSLNVLKLDVLLSAHLFFFPQYSSKHGVLGGSDVCHPVIKVKKI